MVVTLTCVVSFINTQLLFFLGSPEDRSFGVGLNSLF